MRLTLQTFLYTNSLFLRQEMQDEPWKSTLESLEEQIWSFEKSSFSRFQVSFRCPSIYKIRRTQRYSPPSWLKQHLFWVTLHRTGSCRMLGAGKSCEICPNVLRSLVDVGRYAKHHNKLRGEAANCSTTPPFFHPTIRTNKKNLEVRNVIPSPPWTYHLFQSFASECMTPQFYQDTAELTPEVYLYIYIYRYIILENPHHPSCQSFPFLRSDTCWPWPLEAERKLRNWAPRIWLPGAKRGFGEKWLKRFQII